MSQLRSGQKLGPIDVDFYPVWHLREQTRDY